MRSLVRLVPVLGVVVLVFLVSRCGKDEDDAEDAATSSMPTSIATSAND